MNLELLKTEIRYRTARSGGKGGQNVNKVETKVEAVLDLNETRAFSEEELALLRQKLAGQISGEGMFSVVNQTERSQLGNKIMAEQKLIARLQAALKPVKKRKKVGVPTRIIEARKKAKMLQSEKKQWRRQIRGAGF